MQIVRSNQFRASEDSGFDEVTVTRQLTITGHDVPAPRHDERVVLPDQTAQRGIDHARNRETWVRSRPFDRSCWNAGAIGLLSTNQRGGKLLLEVDCVY